MSGFGWRYATDFAVRSTVVVLIAPVPESEVADQLGLEQRVQRLECGIVVAVALDPTEAVVCAHALIMAGSKWWISCDIPRLPRCLVQVPILRASTARSACRIVSHGRGERTAQGQRAP